MDFNPPKIELAGNAPELVNARIEQETGVPAGPDNACAWWSGGGTGPDCLTVSVHAGLSAGELDSVIKFALGLRDSSFQDSAVQVVLDKDKVFAGLPEGWDKKSVFVFPSLVQKV